jgi:hypothetical protein
VRAIRLTAMIVAAVAMTAACSPNAAPPAEPSTSVAPDGATGHGAFAKCLADNGVPAERGGQLGAPPGVDQDTWHKAMQACSSLAPGPPPG